MATARTGADVPADDRAGRFDGGFFDAQPLRAELERREKAFAEVTVRLATEGAARDAQIQDLRRSLERLAANLQRRDADLARRVDDESGAHGDRAASLQRELASVEAELHRTRETAARLGAELQEARTSNERLQAATARSYAHLKRRLVATMAELIPAGATALVISRGDDDLLQVEGRTLWHFPRTPEGFWAGHYPADSAAAIAELDRLRAQGASYLVLPDTARWWLDHYDGLRSYLRRFRVVCDRADVGLIVDVAEPAWQRRLRAALSSFEKRVGRRPAVLDWDSGLELAAVFPDHAVFSPPVPADTLPYLDASVDIVVCPRRAPAAAEARRVASAMVVTVSPSRTSGRKPDAEEQRPTLAGIQPVVRPAPRPTRRRSARTRAGARVAPLVRREVRRGKR